MVTEVASAASLSDLAFWQQGDASLYTDDNVKKRTKLRHSADCVEVLEAFWRVAKSSAWSREEKCENGSRGSEESVKKEAYTELYLRVHKTLLEAFSLDEALSDVQNDWLADARGGNSLTREPFADTLFELADSACAQSRRNPVAPRVPGPWSYTVSVTQRTFLCSSSCVSSSAQCGFQTSARTSMQSGCGSFTAK